MKIQKNLEFFELSVGPTSLTSFSSPPPPPLPPPTIPEVTPLPEVTPPPEVTLFPEITPLPESTPFILRVLDEAN